MANRFKESENKVKAQAAAEVKEPSLVNAGKETSKAGIVIAADKKEARSKRVNLLIKPSVYDEVKAKCDKLGISVNECVNQFLEKWIEE